MTEPEKSQRDARSLLDRAARESETVGASSMARTAERLQDHFTARDALDGEADPIELWGRRIGRALSLLGTLALLFWLGVQLNVW